jgi:predicted ester cyclase
MSEQQNKAIIHRYIEEVFNKGNISLVEEFVAENYTVHTGLGMEIKGIQGAKDFISMIRKGFPDLHGTIEHLVAESDEVAYRVIWNGTHQEEIFGQAPTGKHVSFVENTFI